MWLLSRSKLLNRGVQSSLQHNRTLHSKTVTKTTDGLECITYTPDTPTTKQPILYVHGEWTGAWFWDEQVLPYSASKAFSIVGHGESPKTNEFEVATIKNYTRNLHSAIKHLYGDETFPILVGHGLGSLVVLNYLRNTPSIEKRDIPSQIPEIKKDAELKSTIPPYLNSVILVNPYEPPVAHYVMPPMFSRLMKKEPSALFPLIFQMGGVQVLRNEPLARHFFFSPEASDEVIQKYYPKLGREPKALLHLLYYHPAFKPTDTFNARDFLIIRGAKDEWCPEEYSTATAALIGVEPGAVKVIHGATHSFPLVPEYARECVDLIVDHVKNVEKLEEKLAALNVEENVSLLDQNKKILEEERAGKKVTSPEVKEDPNETKTVSTEEIEKQAKEKHEKMRKVLESQQKELQDSEEETKSVPYTVQRTFVEGLELVRYVPKIEAETDLKSDSQKPQQASKKGNHSAATSPKHPLLFLHGDWTGAWIWEDYFMPYFASRGYTCYAVSLLGHGESKCDAKKSQMASVNDFASNIKYAYNAITSSETSPPIVIAHSLATMYTTKLFNDPEVKVPFVFMMNPPRPPFDDDALIYFHRKLSDPSLVTFFKSLFNKDIIARPIQSPEIAKKWLFSEGLPDSDVMRYFPNLSASSYKAPVTWRAEKLDENYVKSVQSQKIHVMFGEDDKLVDMEDVPEIMSFFGYHQAIQQQQQIMQQNKNVKRKDLPPPTSFTNPDGTGVTIFPDVAHCMMVDPFWEEVSERMLRILQKFESKEDKKSDMLRSLSNSLKKGAR